MRANVIEIFLKTAMIFKVCNNNTIIANKKKMN